MSTDTANKLPASTVVAELPWLRPPAIKALGRIGIYTLQDLLEHFPRRYEDRSHFARFPATPSEEPICVIGTIVDTSVKFFGRKKILEVTLQEGEGGALTGVLTCRWFNAHYVQKMVAVGQILVAFGKPKRKGNRMFIDHPDFEIVETDAEQFIHWKRIVPVHPATEGLTARVIRALIWKALEAVDPATVKLTLPERDGGGSFAAFRAIHFPGDMAALEEARRQLVLAEFFRMQMVVAARRYETRASPGVQHCGDGALVDELVKSLPFPLTGAQQRAIREIRADLASTSPMNRLLQGDVGSGKTLVAFAAMLSAVEAGFQAALMAPTQILAEQHYTSFSKLAEPLGIGLALRTGTRKEDTHMPLFSSSSRDAPSIIIGTHALLFDSFAFENLGMIVIDEQHKFGVMQRARLIEQGTHPDVLVMTATPIPRTLGMTYYGDLAVSTLDELPPGRGKITTGIRHSDGFEKVLSFLKDQLHQGRQIYIVYPIIEESEKLEAKAAAVEFNKWIQLLAPAACELLHGRIPPEEKDGIMKRFRNADAQVLVATSVIEVGIDVPNATVILIENAERFGLAQLHQLRGRVGRGIHNSYCILMLGENADDEVSARLRILEETRDGFRIADEDFAIRGPGDMLGTAQSGLPPLKLGDLRQDGDILRLAKKLADEIFEQDPTLSRPENEHFRILIVDAMQVQLSQIS